MSYQIIRKILLVAFSYCLISFSAKAQPPAQGPAATDAQANGLSMKFILNAFETAVQTQIDSLNTSIANTEGSTHVAAHVSYSYKAFPPYMTQTLFADRPNENQIRMSLMATYDITGIRWHGIPYFSRTIYQSIDIYTSCTNWSSNNGSLNFTFVAQQPYLDGNSFGEDALNFFVAGVLSDFVDSKLRGRLSSSLKTVADPLAKCNCLGVIPGTDQNDHYKASEIRFQLKAGRVHVIDNASVLNTETVTVQSIKRLAAHDNTGTVLYKPQEDIGLQLYINQTLKIIPVGIMNENDTKTFNGITVSFPKPKDDNMLVLIANIVQQDNSYMVDSQFGVYKKEDNFGNGTRKLTISKYYWQQPVHLPGGGVTKPIKITVSAYEITFLIRMPGTESTM
jgi:hypothetical protein